MCSFIPSIKTTYYSSIFCLMKAWPHKLIFELWLQIQPRPYWINICLIGALRYNLLGEGSYYASKVKSKPLFATEYHGKHEHQKKSYLVKSFTKQICNEDDLPDWGNCSIKSRQKSPVSPNPQVLSWKTYRWHTIQKWELHTIPNLFFFSKQLMTAKRSLIQ